MVLRREQRDDVALEHEVGLDGPLDRLLDLGVGLVDDVPNLLADPSLPVRQGVDVGVDPGILRVTHLASTVPAMTFTIPVPGERPAELAGLITDFLAPYRPWT